MSDYLTTLAVRTLAPPASIRPRPAARFESTMTADQPMSDRVGAPLPVATGGAPRVHLHDASARNLLDDKPTGGPGVSARVHSSQDSERTTEKEEGTGSLPRRRSDKKRGFAARKTRGLEPEPAAVVGDETSGDLPVSATAQAIQEIETGRDGEQPSVPPVRPLDDGAAPETVTPMEDRGAWHDEHVKPLATSVSVPAPRSTARSQIRRARAERDESPHITVAIGRVEVTPPVPQPPPTDKGIRGPALGLDDYLEGRERS